MEVWALLVANLESIGVEMEIMRVLALQNEETVTTHQNFTLTFSGATNDFSHHIWEYSNMCQRLTKD